MERGQGRTRFNGRWCAIDMRAGDGEVAPLTVHLNGCLWMGRAWYGSPSSAWNGATDQDMDARLARGVFRVALELVEVGLGPGVDTPVGIDAVIQVHVGIVPLEDIADAIIVTSALRLHRLGIARPGLRIIRLGFAAHHRA